jgi:hypothetical protein
MKDKSSDTFRFYSAWCNRAHFNMPIRPGGINSEPAGLGNELEAESELDFNAVPDSGEEE